MIRRKPRRPPARTIRPTRAARRARAPQAPRGVELFLVTVMRGVAARFAAAISKRLMGHVAKFAKPEETAERHDAEEEDEDVDDMMDALREIAEGLRTKELESGTKLAGQRVVDHSEKEFDRLGIDLVKDEPKWGPLIDKWQSETVDRIRGMQDDQLDKIKDILRNGRAHRAETLADELEEQLEGVTRSRAEFIARDATLKLNAHVTRERQKACGIEQYIWSTSLDERVRDTHAELEGQTFSWDDQPVVNEDGDVGHTGDDYQCRCVAVPILPELDEDDDEESDQEGDDEPPTDEDDEEAAEE